MHASDVPYHLLMFQSHWIQGGYICSSDCLVTRMHDHYHWISTHARVASFTSEWWEQSSPSANSLAQIFNDIV